MDVKGVVKPVAIWSEIFLLKSYFITTTEFVPRSKNAWFYGRFLSFGLICITCFFASFNHYRSPNDSFSTTGFIQCIHFVYHSYQAPMVISLIFATHLSKNTLIDFLNTLMDLDKMFADNGYTHDYKNSLRILYGLITFSIVDFCFNAPILIFDIDSKNLNLSYIAYSYLLLTRNIYIQVPIVNWIMCHLLFRKHFMLLNKLFNATVRGGIKYEAKVFVITDTKPNIHIIARDEALLENLKIIYQLYNKLCFQAKNLNSSFSWQILIIMPYLINLLLFTVYHEIKLSISNTPPRFDLWYEGLFGILCFCEVCLCTLLTTNQANEFVLILKETDLDLEKNSAISEVMNLISLQAIHLPIQFSSVGVFALNGQLLFMVCGGLVTQLVMLLQI